MYRSRIKNQLKAVDCPRIIFNARGPGRDAEKFEVRRKTFIMESPSPLPLLYPSQYSVPFPLLYSPIPSPQGQMKYFPCKLMLLGWVKRRHVYYQTKQGNMAEERKKRRWEERLRFKREKIRNFEFRGRHRMEGSWTLELVGRRRMKLEERRMKELEGRRRMELEGRRRIELEGRRRMELEGIRMELEGNEGCIWGEKKNCGGRNEKGRFEGRRRNEL